MDTDSFSVRHGYVEMPLAPLESITSRIRHAMWNVVYEKACKQAYVCDVVKKARIYLQMPIDDIQPYLDYSKFATA